MLFAILIVLLHQIYLKNVQRKDSRLRKLRRQCLELFERYIADATIEDIDGAYVVIYDKSSKQVMYHTSYESEEIDQWNDITDLLRVSDDIRSGGNAVLRNVVDMTNGRHLHAICKYENYKTLCILYMPM